jgi:hypothetical protein
MNYHTITRIQKEYGYFGLQAMINSGDVWKLEGAAGREAMSALQQGFCMLPKKSTRDYYGNYIPSRDELKKGTKGTYQNCLNFWSSVMDGTINLY